MLTLLILLLLLVDDLCHSVSLNVLSPCLSISVSASITNTIYLSVPVFFFFFFFCVRTCVYVALYLLELIDEYEILNPVYSKE